MNDDLSRNEMPEPEEPRAPEPAVPAPPKEGGWQMPQPKFQQTSGYLPQGYIDQVGLGNLEAAGTAASAVAEPVTEPAPLEVEPQPDLSAQLDVEPMPTPPPAPVKERSAGARTAMIVLGVLAMILFIAVFLGVVYYLFLAPQNGGSTF